MNILDTQTFLRDSGVKMNSLRGQNFLVSQNYFEKLVQLINENLNKENVVEIGPE